MNVVDVVIGARLAVLRVERKLDVPTLAAAAGCPPDRLASFERGGHVPAAELLALCRALRVRPGDLLRDLAALPPGAAAAEPTMAAEGLRLNAAFARIADPRRRDLLVAIAERLAEAAGPGPT